MSMTKVDYRRKEIIIDAMCRTAADNGKLDEKLHMTWIAGRLHRIETTLSRLAEEDCSSILSKADVAKQNRLEWLAENLIKENIGCKCYIQRDPRGYAIRMYLNGYSNQFDGTAALMW